MNKVHKFFFSSFFFQTFLLFDHVIFRIFLTQVYFLVFLVRFTYILLMTKSMAWHMVTYKHLKTPIIFSNSLNPLNTSLFSIYLSFILFNFLKNTYFYFFNYLKSIISFISLSFNFSNTFVHLTSLTFSFFKFFSSFKRLLFTFRFSIFPISRFIFLPYSVYVSHLCICTVIFFQLTLPVIDPLYILKKNAQKYFFEKAFY